VSLFSQDLEKDYIQIWGEKESASRLIDNYTQQLKELGAGNETKETRVRYQSELAQAQARLDSAQYRLKALDTLYNGAARPGYFHAIAPAFDSKLARPINASQWTVLNDDRRENLRGRTMKPHEELLRVGNLDGYWHIELKIPQRNIGQVMKAFADPDLHKVDAASGKKYLDVDVLLSSQPETSYGGRLYRDDIAAQAVPNKNEHDENEPVVTAYVKLNLSDFELDKMVPVEQFVTGLEVRTRVRCGNHALGYSLFHGVWEWFYEKVVFFF
jgi:hypothetical protein